MKPGKNSAGKLCVVEFDDTGRMDGMLLEEASIDGSWRVYCFGDQIVHAVGNEQIIEIGDLVRPRG